MNKNLIGKIIICIFILGLSFYLYLEKQNALTQVRMKIPKIAKDLRAVKEENLRLEYAIEKFESPEHLIDLLRTNQFSSLKHPLLDEVLTVRQKEVFTLREKKISPSFPSKKSYPTLVIGAISD